MVDGTDWGLVKHHLIKNLKVFKTGYVRNVAEVSTLYL